MFAESVGEENKGGLPVELPLVFLFVAVIHLEAVWKMRFLKLIQGFPRCLRGKKSQQSCLFGRSEGGEVEAKQKVGKVGTVGKVGKVGKWSK